MAKDFFDDVLIKLKREFKKTIGFLYHLLLDCFKNTDGITA